MHTFVEGALATFQLLVVLGIVLVAATWATVLPAIGLLWAMGLLR